MAEASRSIAIALTTNLHVGFDAQLLRTHTASAGPSLNLFGPPYHAAKSPFLCTFDGPVLWTMPPLCPWTVEKESTNDLPNPPLGSRFRGLSTKGGNVTLIYDVGIAADATVRVHEQPIHSTIGAPNAIVRRFEIAPCDKELWLMAHAEMGSFGKLAANGAGHVLIQRSNDCLLAIARGSDEFKWQTQEKAVSYEVVFNADKGGESDVRRMAATGNQARAFLRIAPHAKPQAFEIATAICRDTTEALQLASNLARSSVTPPRMDFIAGQERDARTVPAAPITPRPELVRLMRNDGAYQIEPFPIPAELDLKITGMDWISDDTLAVCTWAGDVYLVEHAQGPAANIRYRRFARGLNEPLGLKVAKKEIYVVQKSELTRLVDTDGNGEADLFQTVNYDWGYSGNYHAFAFGPAIDNEENFYVLVCGQRARWEIPFAGWCMKIDAHGKSAEPFCSGLRAPNGFGMYQDDLFVTDNQGEWNGACKLNHLQRGRFYGFPSGIPAPQSQYGKARDFQRPALWFPRKLSPSASGFATIDDDRFGPFKGQLIVGDFQNAVLLRVFLEKVNGDWQGAVWPFAKGFLSGVNRVAMGPDGNLYVGGLKNAAWPAIAPMDYSLERVSFTGKSFFEIKEARAKPDGFELVFTEPVDRATAEDTQNYSISQFTYLYHSKYGSPEIDHAGAVNSASEVALSKVSVAADGLRVRLTLDGWRPGYVTAVRSPGLRSKAGAALSHDAFYYTLNQIPRVDAK